MHRKGPVTRQKRQKAANDHKLAKLTPKPCMFDHNCAKAVHA